MQNNLIEKSSHLLQMDNFTMYFNRWLLFVDIKSTSIKTYNATIKSFLKYLQDNQIIQPTRQDIIIWRDCMIKNGLKANTVKNKIQIIKSFFKWLEYENIYKNIALNIKSPKISNEYKHDYLTENQIKDLLKIITNKRDYAIILLMITSGLRIHEIASANINDIKNKNGYKVLYILGKGHETKEDYIIITDFVYSAIMEYLKTRKDQNESLFISNQIKPISTRQLERIINNYFVKLGIKNERLTAHSLRTTTATMNYKQGATLEEIKTLLRHKSINTTLMYTHLLERENNNCEQKISNLIQTLIREDEKQKII